jgi:hypothetical protein
LLLPGVLKDTSIHNGGKENLFKKKVKKKGCCSAFILYSFNKTFKIVPKFVAILVLLCYAPLVFPPQGGN